MWKLTTRQACAANSSSRSPSPSVEPFACCWRLNSTWDSNCSKGQPRSRSTPTLQRTRRKIKNKLQSKTNQTGEKIAKSKNSMSTFSCWNHKQLYCNFDLTSYEPKVEKAGDSVTGFYCFSFFTNADEINWQLSTVKPYGPVFLSARDKVA
eukprot:g21447.t1